MSKQETDIARRTIVKHIMDIFPANSLIEVFTPERLHDKYMYSVSVVYKEKIVSVAMHDMTPIDMGVIFELAIRDLEIKPETEEVWKVLKSYKDFSSETVLMMKDQISAAKLTLDLPVHGLPSGSLDRSNI